MSEYGFVWGNVWVERLAHLPGKGRIIRVGAAGGGDVQVYVSEGGRSIRAFRGDKEMKVSDDDQ